MTRGTAIITGASTGIGATYADRLAKRGYGLLLVARDRPRMETLAARLVRETGVGIQIVKADLTVTDQLLSVEMMLRSEPGIVMLVNNAGIGGGGPLKSADPNYLEQLIALNVRATTRLAAAAASRFGAQAHGTIINISSVTALFPERMDPVYPATKAYLLALSQSLAAELSASNVRVQVVMPGATRTEIWERAGGSLDSLPPEIIMDVDDLVDAALAGLDLGEIVTIPSLPDHSDWQRFEDARTHLQPNLSRSNPAARYAVAGSPINPVG